jgi:hypothetical protein
MAAHLNCYINTTKKDNKSIKPRVYIRGAIVWDTVVLLESICTRLAEDTFAQGIIGRLQDNKVAKTTEHLAVSKAHVDQWELQRGLLLHSGARYIPNVADLGLQILQQVHNHPLSGHFSIAKTQHALHEECVTSQRLRLAATWQHQQPPH